jgi:type IV pilus assembly protein PilO
VDLEELVSRYRLLPIAARLLIALLVGLIPAYYVYLDEGDGLETQMTEAKDKLSVVEAKFERERTKRNKLPELEAKLAFTEQQLKESSKRLPDTFLMNDVLQEASTIARDVGVELQVFDPGASEPGGDAFKYMEMPIELVIAGKYNQIANFYDRLANLEKMVHVRNIKLGPLKSDNKAINSNLAIPNPNDDLSAMQRRARADFRIQASAAMVIYRAMTPAEEQKLPKPAPGVKPAEPSNGKRPESSEAPSEEPRDGRSPERGPRGGRDDEAQFSVPEATGKLAVGAIQGDEKI